MNTLNFDCIYNMQTNVGDATQALDVSENAIKFKNTQKVTVQSKDQSLYDFKGLQPDKTIDDKTAAKNWYVRQQLLDKIKTDLAGNGVENVTENQFFKRAEEELFGKGDKGAYVAEVGLSDLTVAKAQDLLRGLKDEIDALSDKQKVENKPEVEVEILPQEAANKSELPEAREITICQDLDNLSLTALYVFRSKDNVVAPSEQVHRKVREFALRLMIRFVLEEMGVGGACKRTIEQDRALLGEELFDKLISPDEDMTFADVESAVRQKCEASLNPPNPEPPRDEPPSLETLKTCHAQLGNCKTADDAAKLLSKVLVPFPGLADEGEPTPSTMRAEIVQKYCELCVKEMLDRIDPSLWAAHAKDVRPNTFSLIVSMDAPLSDVLELEVAVTREQVDAALASKLREIVCDALPTQHQVAALDAVQTRMQGRSVKEQCLAYNALLAGYCEKLKTERNGVSMQDFAATFDFNAALGDVAPDADVPPQLTHRFMSAFVERFKSELDVQGKINDKLAEDAKELNANTKYKNICDAMKFVLKFRAAPKAYHAPLTRSVAIGKLMRNRYEAEQANPGSVSEEQFITDYQKISPKKKKDAIKQEWEGFVANKRKQEKQQLKNPRLITYPSNLTKIGEEAGKKIELVMGVGAHKASNTAEDMLASFEAFCSIHDLFFKCVEADLRKQDPAMPSFHKLLDAMDMPGCLQMRVEPLQFLMTELDLGVDLNDDHVIAAGDDLAQGMGKVVQTLYANKQDEVEYDEVVKGYLDAVGANRQVKLGLHDSKLEQRLLTKFGGKNKGGDVVVPMSHELLNDPDVKAAIKNMFYGMIKE